MNLKLTIPLLRFMYFYSRKSTKRKNITVMNGGKMSEEDYQKAIKEVELLTNKNI